MKPKWMKRSQAFPKRSLACPPKVICSPVVFDPYPSIREMKDVGHYNVWASNQRTERTVAVNTVDDSIEARNLSSAVDMAKDLCRDGEKAAGVWVESKWFDRAGYPTRERDEVVFTCRRERVHKDSLPSFLIRGVKNDEGGK